MDRVELMIRHLQLQPHPEGGYYRETYRSSGTIEQDDLDAEFAGRRNFSTCIYFMLTSDSYSAFHKIRSDEIWHFYDGSPIRLHMILNDGSYAEVIMGSKIDQGQVPQYAIMAGTWFGATVVNDNDYSLLGCTVSPGFDFRDFTLGNREELIKQFPEHKEIISKMIRK